MTEDELHALGHKKEPLLDVIRRNCLDCVGNSIAEVRRCTIIKCPFWPYRFATNPFRRHELSAEQRAEIGGRLRRARQAPEEAE